MADLDLDELERLLAEESGADLLHWTAAEDRLAGAAVNALPALIAEVRRLRKALTEIRDCCADRERVVMIGVRLFAGIESVAAHALEDDDG